MREYRWDVAASSSTSLLYNKAPYLHYVNIPSDRYQEGYDAGFEKGCAVGVEMARGAKDLQAEFDRLMGCTQDDKIKNLVRVMAQYILSGVPLECETCTNMMKNMEWKAKCKGCDGDCQHENGFPKTIEEVVLYFEGKI